MTSAPSQEKIALANGTLPTRMDAFTAKVVFKPEVAAFRLAFKDGVPRQPIPEYTALYAAMEPNLLNILTGRTTAQQGLRKTADQPPPGQPERPGRLHPHRSPRSGRPHRGRRHPMASAEPPHVPINSPGAIRPPRRSFR
ncbi:hypothetical protein [Streptomyces sp. NPDC055632]